MFSQGWSRQKCSCHRSRPLPSVEGGWFQDWNETLNNPERGRECRDRLPSRALCCGLQAMACPGGGLLQRRRGAQWGPCPPCSPLSGPLLNFPSPHQSQRGPQGEGILLCPFFFFFFSSVCWSLTRAHHFCPLPERSGSLFQFYLFTYLTLWDLSCGTWDLCCIMQAPSLWHNDSL